MIRASVVADICDHLLVRAPEWWAAIMMPAIGGWLALPIGSFALSPSYAFMAQLASEASWARFLMELAGARLLALILNGTFRRTRRWSPLVRSAAAGLSAATWTLIAVMTWDATGGALITPIAAMIAAGEFGLCLFVARQAGAAAQEHR